MGNAARGSTSAGSSVSRKDSKSVHCSETAASGPGGSAIEPRPIPAEQVDGFRFGSVKSKQKPLKRNGKGELTTLSLSGFTRKMSDDTRAYFDSLFDDAT